MGMIARVAAMAAAAVLCAWALVEWVYVPVRCSMAVTQFSRRTDAALKSTDDYQRIVRARRNLADFAWMRERCAADVRVPMLAAGNERLLGRLEEALRSYEAALAADRRPEIYAAHAETLLLLGRMDEAAESYIAAARFAPEVMGTVPSEEIQRRVEERLRARR